MSYIDLDDPYPQQDMSYLDNDLPYAPQQPPGIMSSIEYSDNTLTTTGPRQSRKPAADDGSDSKTSLPSFDPVKLLNPKAAASSNRANKAKDTDHLSNGNVSPTQNGEAGEADFGMGNMIERMHNVNKRKLQPQKKRKSEGSDDEGKKRSKSTFAGGKGGIIGEHLRAEREKGAADAGPLTEPIDLTNDDEDDPILVGASSVKKPVTEDMAKEVCLGAINSFVNTHKVPACAQTPFGRDMWPRIRVTLVRQPNSRDFVIQVRDRNDDTFGFLDPKTAYALAPLMSGSSVNKMRTKAHLEVRKREENEISGQKGVSKPLKMVIILFAPRLHADQIGKFLSQKMIWLCALPVDYGKEVYNPHAPRDFRPKLAPNSGAAQPMTFVTRSAEEMRQEASNMFDELVKSDDLPEMEANENYIITELLGHQKQALHFLVNHEKSDYDFVEDSPGFSLWKPQTKSNGQRVWYNVITGHETLNKPNAVSGGILADMMGLGKTLSILALISDTRDASRSFGHTEPSPELKRDTTIKRNAKTTLIVCPKSVMSNWEEQIRLHTRGLKYYSYHGTNRSQDLDFLARQDIVITSYNTVGAEFVDANRRRRATSSIQWFRVVLDEAHQIRTQNTQASKACCALYAERRWAVTGTPVQNRLEDLAALIKFLKVQPFDDLGAFAQYIIAPFKNANTDVIQHLRLLVDSITLRRMKDRIDLPGRHEHIVRLDFSTDEYDLYHAHSRYSNTKVNAMMNDRGIRGKGYAHVLAAIGRLRAICAHGSEMLTDEELKITEGMNAATAIDLGDDPDIDDKPVLSDKQAYDMFRFLDDSDMNHCSKCNRQLGRHDDDEEEDESEDDEEDLIGYMTPCFQLLCPNCIDWFKTKVEEVVKADNYMTCPLCEQYVRASLTELYQTKVDEDAVARRNAHKDAKKIKYAGRYTGPHTKVKALVSQLSLSKDWSEQHSDEPPERSVVFSGWTSYLDLIGIGLDDAGITYVRLDGSMSVKARSRVMEQFRTDPSIAVILVSIKAGGQGLNFTAANKVYMMEPQFNPGVEQQAIDRVHRLGQTREVNIIHYIMADSFEETILKLQDKKQKLAALSMEKKKMSKAEELKQKIEELRDLFK